MTPTPRTDEAASHHGLGGTVSADFARELELELSAVTKERDELAICHDTQRDRADAYMEMSDKLKSELAAVTAERDEALLALGGIQSEIREAFDLDKTPITPDEVREVCDRHAGSGIHTCHENCQRIECVLRRELSSVAAERDRLQRAYDAALRQMNEAIAKAEWLRTDRIAQLERELSEITADRDEWKYALTSIHPTDRGTPAEMARDIMDGATALREALKFSAGERDALRAEIEDIKNATLAAMDESCDCNERHCSCVPLLRAEVKRLRHERDAARKLADDLAETLSDLWHHYSLTGAGYEVVESALAMWKKSKP